MFCIECGYNLPDDAGFCPKCGAPIAAVDSVQQTSIEPVPTASQKPVESPMLPPTELVSTVAQESPITPVPIVSADGVEKKTNKKLIVSLVTIVCVAIFTIVIFALNRDDTGKYIDMVKNVRPFNSGQNMRYWGNISWVYSLTTPSYDTVFNKYMEQIEWKVVNDNLRSTKSRYVDIKGKLKGSGDEMIVNFYLAPEATAGRDDRYEYYSIIPNTIILNGETITDSNKISDFLFEMFDAYVRDYDYFNNASTQLPDIDKRDSNINYPGEVVYNGTSIAQIINSWTIDAVTAWLGEPSHDDYYAGGRYFNFNDNISFFFDQDTRKINIIMVTPTAVRVDGVTLDKNREGLINILGVPGYENTGYNEMEGTNFYFMQYFFADYNYYIDMPDRNSKADSITFYNNSFYDGGLDTITQQNQSTFPATHIVVTNDGTNLRLRDAPGFNSTQISSLEYGSSVRVLEIGVSAVDDAGNRGNWTYITTEDGRTGWCFGAYLQPLP